MLLVHCLMLLNYVWVCIWSWLCGAVLCVLSSLEISSLRKSKLSLPLNTVIPVLSGHSIKYQKLAFKTGHHSMQVKSVAECILQYFQPSLSYHLSLCSLFCLVLICRFRHV